MWQAASVNQEFFWKCQQMYEGGVTLNHKTVLSVALN